MSILHQDRCNEIHWFVFFSPSKHWISITQKRKTFCFYLSLVDAFLLSSLCIDFLFLFLGFELRHRKWWKIVTTKCLIDYQFHQAEWMNRIEKKATRKQSNNNERRKKNVNLWLSFRKKIKTKPTNKHNSIKMIWKEKHRNEQKEKRKESFEIEKWNDSFDARIVSFVCLENNFFFLHRFFFINK